MMGASPAIVWVNGALCASRHAISAQDRGFLLAHGAFETLLVRNGAPIFWSDHEARLMRGLDRLGIPVEPAASMLAAGKRDLGLLSDATNLAGVDVLALRITVTGGVGGRGLSSATMGAPTVVLSLSELAETREPTLRGVYRGHAQPASPFSSFKYLGGYGVNRLARAWAEETGHDDALLVNAAGSLVSATVATLFVIAPGGAVSTPPLVDGALPGLTRARLLQRLPAIEEMSVSPDDLTGKLIVLANALTGPRVARLAGEASAPTDAQSAAAQAMRNGWLAAIADPEGA